MIGIICALAIEVEGLQKIMKNPKREVWSKITYITGEINGKTVVTTECGIGKVNAAMCAQVMIDRYSPEIIINSGIAGALSSDISIGDIVISTDCVQHDYDCTEIGDPIGQIQFSDERRVDIPANKEIADKLYRACLLLDDTKVVKGRIATGDRFVSNRANRRKIAETFSALACEMEGGAIGQVCYRNDVPFAVLRCISDDSDENVFMEYMKFRSIAADKSIAAIKNFLELL